MLNLINSEYINLSVLSTLAPEALKQVIQKTARGIKYAVLDQRMRGKQEERELILKALSESGIELKKLK